MKNNRLSQNRFLANFLKLWNLLNPETYLQAVQKMMRKQMLAKIKKLNYCHEHNRVIDKRRQKLTDTIHSEHKNLLGEFFTAFW